MSKPKAPAEKSWKVIESAPRGWSRSAFNRDIFRPLGQLDGLKNELALFTKTRSFPADQWPAIDGDAYDIASTYLWFVKIKDFAPLREDVRSNLGRIQDLSQSLANALIDIDDVTLDVLLASNSDVGGLFNKSFFHSYLPTDDGYRRATKTFFAMREGERGMIPGGPFDAPRKALQSGPIQRIQALGEMAAYAKAAFDYPPILRNGPSAAPLTQSWGSPKDYLVRSCAHLIWEHAGIDGARQITGSYELTPGSETPSLARLATAMFEYATNESTDEEGSGNSLERSVRRVAKEWRKLIAEHDRDQNPSN